MSALVLVGVSASPGLCLFCPLLSAFVSLCLSRRFWWQFSPLSGFVCPTFGCSPSSLAFLWAGSEDFGPHPFVSLILSLLISSLLLGSWWAGMKDFFVLSTCCQYLVLLSLVYLFTHYNHVKILSWHILFELGALQLLHLGSGAGQGKAWQKSMSKCL